MELTGKQRRYLRSLAHALKPVVWIGHDGITDAVLDKVGIELENHELIKVKILEGAALDNEEAGPALAAKVRAALVQTIGHQVLLYRPRSEDPDIKLP
ncbi:MAG: ribosome assembly RNA-binding protein YhbY [Deltaproteobacteria bacterium]|nr:ribosome assembly RNA-binding protein YhbY [Deltaproteobacteria bacterium]